MQVMMMRCLVCGDIFGCYDSERIPLKKKCITCTQTRCPESNSWDSHGVCDADRDRYLEKLRSDHIYGLRLVEDLK